jgi:hypothetical protein
MGLKCPNLYTLYVVLKVEKHYQNIAKMPAATKPSMPTPSILDAAPVNCGDAEVVAGPEAPAVPGTVEVPLKPVYAAGLPGVGVPLAVTSAPADLELGEAVSKVNTEEAEPPTGATGVELAGGAGVDSAGGAGGASDPAAGGTELGEGGAGESAAGGGVAIEEEPAGGGEAGGGDDAAAGGEDEVLSEGDAGGGVLPGSWGGAVLLDSQGPPGIPERRPPGP